jgi:ubiquinone biosynthesis protein UbiJ
MTREQEADFLQGQVEYLEDALEGLRKRLEELEAKTQKA